MGPSTSRRPARTLSDSPFESGTDPREESALRAQLSAALSILEEESLRQGPGMMAAVPNQFASLLQSRMLEEPPPGDLQALSAGTGEMSALEVKYDEHDILGWVGSVFTWWRKISPEPWRTPSDAPDPIGNGKKLRVAMMADWGTGLYGAPVCARSIERDPKPVDLLLHLGDVYYSGTQGEVRSRFLDLWPKRSGAISRACNANHEMYTGGEGYFRVLLPAFQQKASYFALQNDHWVLAGLDSAYTDHDLAGDQAAWLEKIVDNAGDRKVVVFSHHQPYSLFDSQGPKLVEKLGGLLGRRRLFAWYWGHEHRCVIVRPASGLGSAWALHRPRRLSVFPRSAWRLSSRRRQGVAESCPPRTSSRAPWCSTPRTATSKARKNATAPTGMSRSSSTTII